MRRFAIIIAFVLMLLPVFAASAQDDKIDSLNFEIVQMKEEKPPYFVVGGGFIGTFFFPKFDDLNAHLKNSGFNLGNDFKTPVFLAGGQGFSGIAVVNNVRVGFWGMGGSKLLEMDTAIISNNISKNYKRGINYSVAFTGFSLDYGIILFKSLAVLPGINIGWGSLSLESYQMGSTYDWNTYRNQTDSLNFLNRAEASFISLEPSLNVEWAVTQFFMFRGKVGYPISFMGNWKFNRVASLNNVPTSINGSGLTAQFGIFVGLFNY